LRVDQLTSREREVMDLVVTGLINKQIGAQLGLTHWGESQRLPARARPS
jgi:FixJ family two-component response regulator